MSEKKEYSKSFVLRLEEDAAIELDKLTNQFSQNQTQAIRQVIMSFRTQERQLAAYKMELAKVQKQLSTVKEDLRCYFDSKDNLQKFVDS
jgi:regulator of sigma D